METRKKQIKQKIFAVLIATFMFTMLFGAVSVRNSLAVDDATNLIQNFVAGTLGIESPASLGFVDLTIGIAANSHANMDYVNFRDYRGGSGNWSLTGGMNDMFTSTAGARNFLSNGNIAWFPQNLTLIGLEGSSTSGIAKGSDGYFDSLRTLVNSGVDYGLGNYRVNSLNFNIQYYGWANQTAGTYQNTLTLTLT
ncbi:MAG: hypothetical protein A2184_02600 [Candidatus Moranbacteria bacterium RIFOXYA1_FULL_44_7]|nr:MAG: hypothetical protein A2184_02600 [Candidatus Moranbacteria bacterium RIFOXYA1_FULL_44_7]